MSIPIFMINKDSKIINAISFDNIEVNDTYITSRNQEGMEEDTSNEEITLFTFDELLTQIENDINLYKQHNDILYLNNAVSLFGKIPKLSKSLSNDIVKESKKLDELFYSIRLYCYNLDSISERESSVKMLAEGIFLGWKYDKTLTYYKDTFLIEGLIKYNLGRIPNIQSRLDYLEFVTNYYIENGDPYPEHDTIPEISMPEETPPIVDDDIDYGEEEEGEHNNGSNSEDNNQSNPDNNQDKPNNDTNNSKDDIYDTVIKFKKSGNDCYKVEETYKNGKIVDSKKVLANKSDYSQCSIYDYINFGSNIVKPSVEIDKDYLYNNQNEDSEYFAYYTVTKNDKTPYYFNTGLRANSIDESLSYNQLSDTLYQLTIKIGAFNVKSNSKSLFVIDGKPIVLNKNTNPNYTKEYVENMLNEYPKLGIKIMKNSEYRSSVEEYHSENTNRRYLNNIIIDEVEVSEDNIAWINSNDIINISTQVIAELLGASTQATEDSLIITKGNVEIIIYNNKKEYYINGESSSFLEKAYKDNNMHISELADIPEKLGYSVDIDLDRNELIFKKIT